MFTNDCEQFRNSTATEELFGFYQQPKPMLTKFGRGKLVRFGMIVYCFVHSRPNDHNCMPWIPLIDSGTGLYWNTSIVLRFYYVSVSNSDTLIHLVSTVSGYQYRPITTCFYTHKQVCGCKSLLCINHRAFRTIECQINEILLYYKAISYTYSLP